MCNLASGDRVAYTCSGCGWVTYAPPHLIAVTCGRCGIIDLGTEIARNRWRRVVEVHADKQRAEEKAAERAARRRRILWVAVAVSAVVWVALAWLVLR